MRAPGARGAVPDRHAGDPGDAGVRQLHRRVLHPDRRLPGEDRLRLRGRRSASSLAAFYAIRLFQRTMHNRTPRRDRVARDRRSATRSCWRRWSPASSRLALYPGLILGRSDAAVKDKIAATCVEARPTAWPAAPPVAIRHRSPCRRPADRSGWTGYAPVRRHDLHRPPHRLRRALARDRADRRDLRRAGRRRCSAGAASGVVVSALSLTTLADRRRACASGSGASARTWWRERCGSTSWGSRPR